MNLIKTIVAPNGELAMGAMWFLYSLFFALSFLSVIVFITSKYLSNNNKEIALFLMVLLATISIVLTRYGMTIPRISNSITIVLMVFIGMFLKNKIQLKFDNFWFFLIALIVYVQCLLLVDETNSFPVNKFSDLQYPIVAGISALYVVLFISKKIATNKLISCLLCFIGKNSLYIMALHIVGLFLCTMFIDGFLNGSQYKMGYNLYTYNIGNNFVLAFLYLVFGLAFPLIMISLFRYLKSRLLCAFRL